MSEDPERYTGTVWTFRCPGCGRVHERRRRVVPVDTANALLDAVTAQKRLLAQRDAEIAALKKRLGVR